MFGGGGAIGGNGEYTVTVAGKGDGKSCFSIAGGDGNEGDCANKAGGGRGCTFGLINVKSARNGALNFAEEGNGGGGKGSYTAVGASLHGLFIGDCERTG